MHNDSDSDGEVISAQDGLSSDTLAALMQFLDPKVQSSLENEPKDEFLCVAYSEKDYDVINATLARLTAKSEATIAPVLTETRRNIQSAHCSQIVDASSDILNDGFVRLDHILSDDLCDRCLLSINESLKLSVDAGNDVYSAFDETGFGNVYSRDFRWDKYLTNDGVYHESLCHMLGSPLSDLSILFSTIFSKNACVEFHEFSALVSDGGSVNQPIHPDSPYQDECPLYTGAYSTTLSL